MKNQMKHLNENLMMPQMMNLKKNLELNHMEKNNLIKNDWQNVSQQVAKQAVHVIITRRRGMTGDLWVEAIISVKSVPCVSPFGTVLLYPVMDDS
nr:hypothetical protein [Tanacetum cinerariifolium]